MLGRLPLALISLLFATVAFSESTSRNDPFRAIVLRVPQPTGPPTCLLKHPQTLEAVDDQVLLSFEDWKAKQSQMQADAASSDAAEKSSERSGHDAETSNGRSRGIDGKEDSSATEELAPAQNGSDRSNGTPQTETSPHFRVPITDRFNYASLDCSARVHTAHRGAKSSSSILSSKKDRYMLSPCNTPKIQKFVVVELCEDIRIDTVQLANFEFFSGVFKDFSVSVAKTYNGPWADAGIYRAKNIRGVQSFHTPSTLRDFYRYIRIDFHSHYGNEYYCPVTLLRVYGLTHLEEWKWQLWETESKAKQVDFEKSSKLVLPVPETVADPNSVASPSDNSPTIPIQAVQNSEPGQPIILGPASPISQEVVGMNSGVVSQADDPESIPPIPNDTTSTSDDSHDPDTSSMQAFHSSSPSLPSATSLDSTATSLSHTPTASAATLPTSSLPSTIVISNNTVPMKPSPLGPEVTETTKTSSARSTITPPSPHPVSSNSVPVPPSPPPPLGTGGESIYRTIMNRLNAIESNHTLYSRYIEQQNGAIRDLIKRLGEDVGRLEAITRAQRTTHQKTLGQLEKERAQMLMDYNQLKSRLDHLSEEIVLEKRLGVIQLCLLFAVLIFVGVTRGSRGESIIVAGPGSVREWGKRHLSLSGDWNRFMRKPSSRSPVRAKPRTPTSTSPARAAEKPLAADKVKFPKNGDISWNNPLEQIQLNTAPLPIDHRARHKKTSQTRSRTPSLRTSTGKRTPQTATPLTQRSGSPTPIRMAHLLRPQPLHRSNSHGMQSNFYNGNLGPKSAKKWARTAHIHPLKSPASATTTLHAQSDAGDENVFSSTSDAFSPGTKSFEKDEGRLGQNFAAQEKDKGGMDEGSVFQPFDFTGDERDTESNWADTDSVAGSEVDIFFD